MCVYVWGKLVVKVEVLVILMVVVVVEEVVVGIIESLI